MEYIHKWRYRFYDIFLTSYFVSFIGTAVVYISVICMPYASLYSHFHVSFFRSKIIFLFWLLLLLLLSISLELFFGVPVYSSKKVKTVIHASIYTHKYLYIMAPHFIQFLFIYLHFFTLSLSISRYFISFGFCQSFDPYCNISFRDATYIEFLPSNLFTVARTNQQRNEK